MKLSILFSILTLKSVFATRFIIQLTNEVELHKYTNKFLREFGINSDEAQVELYSVGKNFQAFSAILEQDHLRSLYNDLNIAAISIDRQLEPQEMIVQKDAPRHLTKLLETEAGDNEFVYDSTAGNGVDIYIFDTGIARNSPGLSASRIHDMPGMPGPPIRDQEILEHGTAMSGLIGSPAFGVLKKCNLIDVNVGDENGKVFMSKVLKGLNLVQQHVKHTNRPSVINFSYCTLKNAILNSAFDNFPRDVPIAVAAGNYKQPGCSFSPVGCQRNKSLLAFGSLLMNDDGITLSDFSNYGSCVGSYAPGEGLLTFGIPDTSRPNSRDTVIIISGTSGSSALGAGVIGYYMAQGIPGEEVVDSLRIVQPNLTSYGKNNGINILKMA
ncbi:hypothetical protein TBLA_0A05410 [Henningerozyma blattae CBS 6284]|uniref:Peptidase S8/S53 domain-containing protein n=1 Tax=Henningerozyma blattae (strain ATCC 34711 / CBS 6284 / DSM 70876 / NBRC 10599 / NRRL Y-10934 / UCD 77-7) TaxID=1071380 RepID=I2GW32_HENB6|nr:hypothetical protein TBLA_0A05410 [Tetrapisispora blattae CBS 6284]CCH58334.1 hypothetical protein TBLA_0A05410 [Tetrapisispora blattae CBS 6284]